MADDPRLSFKERLEAKSRAWLKTHPSAAAQHVTAPTSTNNGRPGSGSVGSAAARWQQKADANEAALASNVFSDQWQRGAPRRDDAAYGRPQEGSKTEYRGQQAGVHVSREVVELCEVITDLGVPQTDGTVAITFGQLFDTYTKISNKLVGMLMRARKQKLVKFKGEMLYQRQDEDTIIWLVQRPEALMEDIERRKEALKQHEQAKKK